MKDYYNELQANLNICGFSNPELIVSITDAICNDDIFEASCAEKEKNEVYEERLKIVFKAIQKTLKP